jgi:hypothetical protein
MLMYKTGTIYTTFVEDYLRINPAKPDKNHKVIRKLYKESKILINIGPQTMDIRRSQNLRVNFKCGTDTQSDKRTIRL